jgi:hypothetical protein
VVECYRDFLLIKERIEKSRFPEGGRKEYEDTKVNFVFVAGNCNDLFILFASVACG